MRILRHKANRKTLAFFRVAYGIVPPYRVLLDGNFLVAASRNSSEWRRLLPKLLQVDGSPQGIFLHITECAAAELSALGGPSAVLAEGVPVLRCRHKHGHTADMDTAACFSALIGDVNTGRFVVATQDAALRGALRRVTGVPIALYSNHVLVLEPPSDASRGGQRAADTAKLGLSAAERASIVALRAAASGRARAQSLAAVALPVGAPRESGKRPRTNGMPEDERVVDGHADEGGRVSCESILSVGSAGGIDAAGRGGSLRLNGAAASTAAARGSGLGAGLAPQRALHPQSKPKPRRPLGPSGPNPLSVRRKAAKPVVLRDGGASEAPSKRARRRRRSSAAAPGGGGAAGAPQAGQ